MAPYSVLETVSETIMVWGLVLVGRLSNVWDAVYHNFCKSLKGVLDAHREKEWVFPQRNTAPLMFLAGWNPNAPSLFTFYPGHNLFSMSPYRADKKYETFSNVVSADIQTLDATMYYDLSSFFHSVSWDKAPTILELIIVWGAMRNIVVTEDFLERFKFTLLTADGVTVTTMLSNTACADEFTGKLEPDVEEVVADEVIEGSVSEVDEVDVTCTGDACEGCDCVGEDVVVVDDAAAADAAADAAAAAAAQEVALD